MSKLKSPITSKILHKAKSNFFPDRRCLACHAPFVSSKLNTFLCANCAPLIQLKHARICNLCGLSLHSEARGQLCLECINSLPPWDTLNYYGLYQDLLKGLILKYKFSADLSLLPLLSHYLYCACQSLPQSHVIIPMPRHNKRLISEGFNHTLELCKLLSKKLNISIDYTALQRTRYTPPQSTLQAKQRKNNPQKSFQASNVEGKNILLIDDVITTGSTLRHASLALRAAGVKNINIAVIARVEK